ncbi:MAG: FAD-dependent oxidoreductase, partial [Alphaproteobacteria bacterium]
MATNLPTQARVVVVGAGVVGSAVAYHLTKLGERDVVVLERARIGCGTTWHSAANVTLMFPSPLSIRFGRYAAELYAGLEKETGQATGWRNCGRVMVAQSRARMDDLKRIAALGRALGCAFELIQPKEVAAKLPLMRTDDLVGGIWSPGDGRVNPTDLTMAYVKGAKGRGARFFEGTPVTGITTKGAAVAGVSTAKGDIACEVVVNCAGLWAKRIGEMAGVTVPLHANEHFYVLTKPISGITPDMPVFRDPDGLIYGREDVGGLLVGAFDTNAKPLPLSRLADDWAFGLLNEDWDQFEPYMKAAIHRFPVLETAQVRMLLNGPESFTPDGELMIGEAPNLRGFFVLAAMNSGGVVYSAGTGRALAEWIVEGESGLDVSAIDIRRFGRHHGNERWLRARAPELSAFHFAVADPSHDFATARDLRCSPLHGRLAATGARFASVMGWERPAWFADHSTGDGWFAAAGREHRAAREASALFDLSSSTKLLISGPDAGALLRRLAAADPMTPPGRVVSAPFLNERGGVESLATLARLDEQSWLALSAPEQATRDYHAIKSRIPPGARVTVLDMSAAWAALGLRGPRAAAVLARAGTRELDENSFPTGAMRAVEVGYATARAIRGPAADEWLLVLDAEYAVAAYEALMAAGAGLGLAHAGHLAHESLRLEDGRPACGRELTPWT